MSEPQTPMAIVYDFDGTLAPGRMQDRLFIPEITGMTVDDFWERVNSNTLFHEADSTLSYMYTMLETAREAGHLIRRDNLTKSSPGIVFFPGVTGWFTRMNRYAEQTGIALRHYVISSGNSEIIEETRIAQKFHRIYASRFLYDQEGCAVWPARAINFINKTQYLYRINKGALDQKDINVINEVIPRPERFVPFENMIYLGDGETDIPCFQTIHSQGGLAIAVYDHDGRDGAERFRQEERVNAIAPADYQPGKLLECIIQSQMDLIAATASRARLLAGPAPRRPGRDVTRHVTGRPGRRITGRVTGNTQE